MGWFVRLFTWATLDLPCAVSPPSPSLQGVYQPQAGELQREIKGLLTASSHQILDGVRRKLYNVMNLIEDTVSGQN